MVEPLKSSPESSAGTEPLKSSSVSSVGNEALKSSLFDCVHYRLLGIHTVSYVYISHSITSVYASTLYNVVQFR